MLTRLILTSIRFYQRTLSPDHGLARWLFPFGACRYQPTCSQYAAQAVARYGAWHGLGLALARLSRCHPWSRRGHWDPVPHKVTSGQ